MDLSPGTDKRQVLHIRTCENICISLSETPYIEGTKCLAVEFQQAPWRGDSIFVFIGVGSKQREGFGAAFETWRIHRNFVPAQRAGRREEKMARSLWALLSLGCGLARTVGHRERSRPHLVSRPRCCVGKDGATGSQGPAGGGRERV